MAGDTFSVTRDKAGKATSSIEIIFSPDDFGWYAHEYDFTNRKDRTSKRVYRNRSGLIRSLQNGKHQWETLR